MNNATSTANAKKSSQQKVMGYSNYLVPNTHLWIESPFGLWFGFARHSIAVQVVSGMGFFNNGRRKNSRKEDICTVRDVYALQIGKRSGGIH